jgi:anti-sigma factor RsiW
VSTADCQELEGLLDLYVDGELSSPERTEVEVHCAQCATCAGAVRSRQSLRRRVRGLAAGVVLPDDVRARLAASIAAAPAATAPRRRETRVPTALALAAGLAGVIAVPWDVTRGEHPERAGVAAMVSEAQPALVAQAARLTQRQMPMEVAGPDSDTVARWFTGKVDFAVNVPDLGRRATLLGGRLGTVDDELAAMLVYELGGAKVSVLMVDSARPGVPLAPAPQTWEVDEGYRVTVQSGDGVTYAFASTLPAAELASLALGAASAR